MENELLQCKKILSKFQEINCSKSNFFNYRKYGYLKFAKCASTVNNILLIIIKQKKIINFNMIKIIFLNVRIFYLLIKFGLVTKIFLPLLRNSRGRIKFIRL